MSEKPTALITEITGQYPNIPAGVPEGVPFWFSAKVAAPDEHGKAGTKVPKGMDLVLVVDRSGSMSGGPLDEVIRTIDYVISVMRSQDRLGVVMYDDKVDTLFELTKMDSAGQSFARRQLPKIIARSRTNIGAALIRALNMMHNRSNPSDVAAVLLLTDGLPNAGAKTGRDMAEELRVAFPSLQRLKPPPPVLPSAPPKEHNEQEDKSQNKGLCAKLARLFRRKKKAGSPSSSSSQLVAAQEDSPKLPPPPSYTQATLGAGFVPVNLPCAVHTFGFSEDHNGTLMREICEIGSTPGAYYYIEDEAAIAPSFGNALGGLQGTVAQQLEVRISVLPPWASIVKVHTMFPTLTEAAGKTVVVTLGDIQEEESKDILVELKCKPLSKPEGTTELARMDMSAHNIVSGLPDSGTATLWIERPKGKEHDDPSPAIEEQINRVTTAAATNVALAAAEAGEFSAAQAAMDNAMSKLKRSKVASTPVTMSLMDDIREARGGFGSSSAYHKGGQHYAEAMQQTHWAQRNNNVKKSMYKGARKSKMESAGRAHIYSGASSSRR